jgi:hypothetical protein
MSAPASDAVTAVGPEDLGAEHPSATHVYVRRAQPFPEDSEVPLDDGPPDTNPTPWTGEFGSADMEERTVATKSGPPVRRYDVTERLDAQVHAPAVSSYLLPPPRPFLVAPIEHEARPPGHPSSPWMAPPDHSRKAAPVAGGLSLLLLATLATLLVFCMAVGGCLLLRVH